MSGGRTVAVIALAATYTNRREKSDQIKRGEDEVSTGAITVARILYFAPSLASVLVNATRPILAAL